MQDFVLALIHTPQANLHITGRCYTKWNSWHNQYYGLLFFITFHFFSVTQNDLQSGDAALLDIQHLEDEV